MLDITSLGGASGKEPTYQFRRLRRCGLEDPLEEAMATSPAFLLGESHGQRNQPGGLQSMGSQTGLKQLSTLHVTALLRPYLTPGSL